MTKDELKKLAELRNRLVIKTKLVEQQENVVAKHEENKKRFCDTVMMSSTDEACRPVESRVIAVSTDPDEKKARKTLKQLEYEKADLEVQFNALQAEVELWIMTIPDWRVQEIFRAKYLENHSVIETADLLGYSEQHVKNVESRFWQETGK